MKKPQIVIVGGGAGGIELTTRLGRTLGKKNLAEIILVDDKATHVWKPLLHEVAAGSLDSNIDQINYFAHAVVNQYSYQPGKMINLDRINKKIVLAPLLDESGVELIPERTIRYDILIISVGSKSNNFNIRGVNQFCLTLDNLEEANLFQHKFLQRLLAINYRPNSPTKTLNIVIIGAGATGVELAAELHHSLAEASVYGFNNPAFKIASISLIEASDRILSALPEGVSTAVTQKLNKLNTKIFTSEQVIEIKAEGVYTKSGKYFPADLCVWAAGIKAPNFLSKLDGLATDDLNRLIVKSNLQTTIDENIFAMGDCAHLRDPDTHLMVPAKAQAAHQQALFLAKALNNQLRKNKKVPSFKYHDRGSIIALACYGAYGNLTSNQFQYFISGKIALFTYRSLYFHHLVTLYGFWTALWFKIARSRILKIRPRLKLHFNKF